MNRFSIVAVAMLAATTAAASAADSVTRVYDVSDLLTLHPSHPLPLAPTAAGASGPVFVNQPTEQSSEAAAVQQAKFLSVVRTALSIDESSKAVTLLDSALIVTEPTDAQQTVAQLLDHIRSSSCSSTQIRVEAEWVLAPPGSLPETASLLSDPKAVWSRAGTVCFSGQTVGVRQVRESAVVTGATPVVGTNVAMNQYTTEIDRPGVQLEVTPQVQPDRTIVVDLKAEAMSEQPAYLQAKLPTTRPQDMPVLQPDKLIQSFATTIALKPGVPTYVGEVTRDTTEPGSKTLCLVITATLVPPPATQPIWK